MADDIDMAFGVEAEMIARGLARIDPTIPQGVPGDCDECGEWMPRLVLGRCGFCRDGRRPPAEAYDRVTRFCPSIEEKAAMTAKATPKSRVITMPCAGAVLDAIEDRAADRDLPLGQAARSFIEEAVANVDEAVSALPNCVVDVTANAAETPVAKWDGTKAGAAIFFANLPDAWLIEELGRRLSSGVGSDDFDAAIARADAAEARLASLRALLVG